MQDLYLPTSHGINHKSASLESPQTIGKMERHGDILKAMLRKTAQETLLSNIEEMETVLSECVAAKNELYSETPGTQSSSTRLGQTATSPRVAS